MKTVVYWRAILAPENESSNFSKNFGDFLPNHTASHPSRRLYSHSLSWEPLTSHRLRL